MKTQQATVCAYSREGFIRNCEELFAKGYKVIPGTVSCSLASTEPERGFYRTEERYIAFFEKVSESAQNSNQ